MLEMESVVAEHLTLNAHGVKPLVLATKGSKYAFKTEQEYKAYQLAVQALLKGEKVKLTGTGFPAKNHFAHNKDKGMQPALGSPGNPHPPSTKNAEAEKAADARAKAEEKEVAPPAEKEADEEADEATDAAPAPAPAAKAAAPGNKGKR